jgi:hypothetical protein
MTTHSATLVLALSLATGAIALELTTRFEPGPEIIKTPPEPSTALVMLVELPNTPTTTSGGTASRPKVQFSMTLCFTDPQGAQDCSWHWSQGDPQPPDGDWHAADYNESRQVPANGQPGAVAATRTVVAVRNERPRKGTYRLILDTDSVNQWNAYCLARPLIRYWRPAEQPREETCSFDWPRASGECAQECDRRCTEPTRPTSPQCREVCDYVLIRNVQCMRAPAGSPACGGIKPSSCSFEIR